MKKPASFALSHASCWQGEALILVAMASLSADSRLRRQESLAVAKGEQVYINDCRSVEADADLVEELGVVAATVPEGLADVRIFSRAAMPAPIGFCPLRRSDLQVLSPSHRSGP